MMCRSCEVYILIWPVWWHTPTDEGLVLVPHFGAIAPGKVVYKFRYEGGIVFVVAEVMSCRCPCSGNQGENFRLGEGWCTHSERQSRKEFSPLCAGVITWTHPYWSHYFRYGRIGQVFS